MATSRFVDLSHPIESGQPGYPGLPAPRIEAYLTRAASRANYQDQAEFEISRIEMVGNTGTYLDSPYHRFEGRPDVAELPLETVTGLPGHRLDGRLGPDGRSVALDLPSGLAGAAVLIRTGWDARWGTPAYWEPGPFVGAVAVGALIEANVALVGVDFWNVDDTGDPARPAHTRLLDAGILIVEHLRGLGPASGDGLPVQRRPRPDPGRRVAPGPGVRGARRESGPGVTRPPKPPDDGDLAGANRASDPDRSKASRREEFRLVSRRTRGVPSPDDSPAR